MAQERLTTLGDRNITFHVEGNEDGQGYLSPVNKGIRLLNKQTNKNRFQDGSCSDSRMVGTKQEHSTCC